MVCLRGKALFCFRAFTGNQSHPSKLRLPKKTKKKKCFVSGYPLLMIK